MANDRELSVEELEEASGGAADANIYCPTTNQKSCNSGCSAETAGGGTTPSIAPSAE